MITDLDISNLHGLIFFTLRGSEKYTGVDGLSVSCLKLERRLVIAMMV